MKWFTSLWNPRKGHPDLLSVGTKVRTSLGRGVIVHGCVSVKYDRGTDLSGVKSHAKKQPNDLTVSHNLDKITIED